MLSNKDRSQPFHLALLSGLLVSVVAVISMIVDMLTTNSVDSHLRDLYEPHGVDYDAGLVWSLLIGSFVIAIVVWIVALRWQDNGARRGRLWGIVTYIIGAGVLASIATITEYGEPLLPLHWQLVCWLLIAIGFVAALLPWISGRTQG